MRSRNAFFLIAAAFALLLRNAVGATTNEPCFPQIRFVGSEPAADGKYWYHFRFVSPFSHPVYYLAYTREVEPEAGMPYHYEQSRKFGRWGPSIVALRHVSMEFRRLDVGETLDFAVLRNRPFWPWRVEVLFYATADYDALTGEVSSEIVRRSPQKSAVANRGSAEQLNRSEEISTLRP